MEYVINEWLPEYFKFDARREDKEILETILNFIISTPGHKIVVKTPSPFLVKLFQYAKTLQERPAAQLELKKFIATILRNSDKCRLVEAHEINLNIDFVEFIESEGNYKSDLYLFEASSTTESKIIITTDQKLIRYVNRRDGFNLITPTEFIQRFIVNQQ